MSTEGKNSHQAFTDADVRALQQIVNGCMKALRRHGPQLQGAALAQLLSMWLAGHQCSDPRRLPEIREVLLANHLELVRQLLPLDDAEAKQRMPVGGHA